MTDAIVRPMITAEQIAERVRALGEEIARDYADRRLVLVCVLKGSFVFTADLARAIGSNLRIEFLGVRSYGEGTSSSGIVQITQDLAPSGRRYSLLSRTSFDTGLTIAHLLRGLLRTRKPASLKVCALLHKPSRTRVQVPIHYRASTIDSKFAASGHGLDGPTPPP